MRPIIFWGGTGQAKVLREAISCMDTSLVAVFDNRDIPSPFDDVPIFHGEAGLDAWEQGYKGERPVHACIAIGGSHGRDRLDLLRMLRNRGYPPLGVAHPRAFIAGDVVFGAGCQVLAFAALCAGCRLGEAVIVNTKASIDHDCIIGDGVHIAPGATLTGEVVVDDFAFIGAGAIVLPRVRIGTGALVGAGAVVTRNIGAGETVIGNPARVFRRGTQ